MRQLVLYIHGKGGNAMEADHYKTLFAGYDVVGLDYHADNPWEAISEFKEFFHRYRKGYDSIILIANSIGAYFSMCAFNHEQVDKAFFISPIVDINDVSTLFPYRRTTIIIDGGECLVGEEGDRNVYVHTRNHSVVSLVTDEIVLNVFWNKLIEKENLLSKGCSGADFLQAIHNLAEHYGITDEMTKNFLVYNFQKEKTQNGKKR